MALNKVDYPHQGASCAAFALLGNQVLLVNWTHAEIFLGAYLWAI